MTVEMEIDQIIVKKDQHDSVFVLRYDMRKTTTYMLEHVKNVWNVCWRQAGWKTPALLMMPDSMELQSLTNDELRKAGLCRIADSDRLPADPIRVEWQEPRPGFVDETE